MRRIERLDTLQESLLLALRGLQQGIWTALPAIVQSFDAAAMTCVLQPSIQSQILAADGTTSWVTLPVVPDVPVCFPSGGGYTLTFPVAAGDEALLVFSSRCIDNWWLSGKVSAQAELRMHDLSDAFAIIGPRSQPRVLSGVSTTSVQLRSDDGSAYVEIAGSHVINVVANVVNVTAPNVNVVASAEVLLTTPLAKVDGELQVTGDVTIRKGHPDELAMTTFVTDYNDHTHGGVTTGSGNTGVPNIIAP